MITRTELTHWTLEVRDPGPDVPAAVVAGPLLARVPGCVHTDLMAACLLDDPYLDRNEETQHWIGRSAWRYTTGIVRPELGSGARHELVLDGVDTVASVTVNGTVVASLANMHRTYRIDVTDVLVPGQNELVVDFRSVYEYADEVRSSLGERPNVYPAPSQYVRKMAANFGWDWGPTLVTAGLWKPAALESWVGARLSSVRPSVGLDHTTGTVDLAVEVQRAPGAIGPLTVLAEVAGRHAWADVDEHGTTARLRLEVPDAQTWWPRGYGEQPLHALRVELLAGAAQNPPATTTPLDRRDLRIGFRDVRLRVEPDADGTSFEIVVNGHTVFARGVNWIPDDCFVSRVDAVRYRERLTQAVEANVNLVRVWGGGLYEKDEFYDTCDELGLLVWQDFLFACSAYPEGEPLAGEVAAEARDNVERLMGHPSLALWNANNENIWGFFDWGWRDELAGRDWGWGFYDQILPEVVAEIDPMRPYWRGSPYSGSMELHPNDPAHGNHHSWEVWNRQDYLAYADDEPRFVSEFGFQGPPAWPTLLRAVGDRPLTPESPGVLAHQKALDGNGKLARGMAPHLPDPTSFEEWHYLTQLNQARAVTFGIEHYRALAPKCAGAIVWQLNDCWPVISWSAVDGDGRRKPLWYALRRVFADKLIVIRPTRASGAAGANVRDLEIVVVNDGPTRWDGTLVVTRRDADGEVQAKSLTPVAIDARGFAVVAVEPELGKAGSPSSELLVAELGDYRAVHAFAEDRDRASVVPKAEVELASIVGGVSLTVRAATLLRDLLITADHMDPEAQVDEQLVTLFPGEERTFTVLTRFAGDDPCWREGGLLRCVDGAVRY